MEKKFNLHDLFGFLFPGSALCAIIYVVLGKIGWVAPGQLDWSATLAMVPIAYVIGVLIHQVGSLLLHEDRVAIRIMQDDDMTFTLAFKQNVREAFSKVFELPVAGDPSTQQTVFNSCYDYVVQQGKGIYVENQYAIYSLCRSMIFVSGVAGALAVFLVARRPTFAWPEYVVMAILVGATGGVIGIFWRGQKRFIKYFAVGVYRAFYSAYRDSRLPRPHAADRADDD